MPTSNLQLFAVCVLIWGSTWIAITFQLGSVAPEMSVAYRFLLAAAAMFTFCRWRNLSLHFSRRQHLDLVLFGASMFCISYILVYYAETYIVSGMVAVAYSGMPMINMVAARIFFGTQMTVRVAVASSFGIAGIACVFWGEFAHLSSSRNVSLGILFTVLSVFASCAGSMMATRTQKHGYSTWASMAWGMLYGGVLALIFGMAMGRSIAFENTTGYVLSLIYLAVMGSIIAFGCYLTLLKRIGAAKSAYIGVMVPIVALTISFFFEKFAWGYLTAAGVSLSIIGNIIILRGAKSD